MILGVGTDLIEIGRIRKACAREGFLRRIYTGQECRQAGGSPSKLAGNFAVKEAVAKALGTGFLGFGPLDIEVLRDGLGRPYVRLQGKAAERLRAIGGGRVHVSISNTRELAIAYAVVEEESRLGG